MTSRPLPPLPPLCDPPRYTGLFVYDFGTHVAVGYTAAEIEVLRASPLHAGGTTYEIYRGAEDGTVELRVASSGVLTGKEAVCFLRADGASAKADYEALTAAADEYPAPCPVDLQLARLYDFDPPDLTALSYPLASTTFMNRWLSEHTDRVGDRVLFGTRIHAQLAAAEGVRIASCRLRAKISFEDRSADEVLRSVGEPVQR